MRAVLLRSLLALLLICFAVPPSNAWAAPAAAAAMTPPVAQPQSPAPDARPSDHPVAREVELPPLPDDFSTVNAGWIDFAYHPSIRGRIQPLLAAADKVRGELGVSLGQSVLSRVHVRIGRTPGEMQKLAPKGAGYPKYASGVAYSEIGLVLLTEEPRYPGEQHDLVEVFRHELAHIALHDAVLGRDVPRWFNEGFAVHASGEAVATRLQTLWTATLAGNLLPLRDLTNRFPSDAMTASVAYAEAADIVRYLLRSDESHRFRSLIERIRTGQTFDQALSDAYSTDLASFEHEWREEVARRYTFWPIFLSGSTVWVVALGLVVWGYKRRKKRAEKTMQRWAVEEAAEDARRAAIAAQMLGRPVHIVLAQGRDFGPPRPPSEHPADVEADDESGSEETRPRTLPPDVPKVEHDGRWHTLH